MRTLFVTAGPIEWGSSRMRCWWVAPHMQTATCITREQWQQGVIPDFDAVVFQKLADPRECAQLVQNGKRVYWDVCDPAWWWQSDVCQKIAEQSHGVVASSVRLAKDFNQWFGSDKAICIPDRLDLSHFIAQAHHADRSPVRFIWFGIAVNRIALYAALANLQRLAADGHKISLTILDDRPDQVWKDDLYEIRHVHWTLHGEVGELAVHDIALLPTYPGPWGRVKSNNKTLTAWAAGLPVTDAQDYAELERLIKSPYERKRLARDGARQVGKLGTVERSAEEWEALLCSVPLLVTA